MGRTNLKVGLLFKSLKVNRKTDDATIVINAIFRSLIAKLLTHVVKNNSFIPGKMLLTTGRQAKDGFDKAKSGALLGHRRDSEGGQGLFMANG